MTLNEMLEKRKNLLNTMDGFLETHKNPNGALSAEDDATYSKMEKEFDELTASITRAQRRANMEMEMNKPVNAPITAKPMVMTEPEDSTGRASKGYKKNFWNAMRRKQMTPEMVNALKSELTQKVDILSLMNMKRL